LNLQQFKVDDFGTNRKRIYHFLVTLVLSRTVSEIRSRGSVPRSDWSMDQEELGRDPVSHIVSDLIVCIVSVSVECTEFTALLHFITVPMSDH